MGHPEVRQTVLDCEDPRALADFYRDLLGWPYRPGDETPSPGEDWLVLRAPTGAGLAFQKVDVQPPSTWPEPGVPQMMHLDLTVPDAEELSRQHDRVLALGGTVLQDRSDDEEEPLWVFADPSGHPFCIFVG